MKRAFLIMLAAVFISFTAFSYASAVLLTPDSVTPFGAINNIAYAHDNAYPSEGGYWQSNTAWWNTTTPSIVFDYGNVFEIQDAMLSVDNNDSYMVEYSSDNSNWSQLFFISNSYGEVGSGMDTMSTDSTHGEYISQLDFSPVSAQYLRIFASGGDNMYSVGEFQAFGTKPTPTAIPEPGTVLLLGVGLLSLAGITRRRLKH